MHPYRKLICYQFHFPKRIHAGTEGKPRLILRRHLRRLSERPQMRVCV